MTAAQKRAATIARNKASKARIEAAQAATRATVAAGVCPSCGGKLVRNLALTGWWQCERTIPPAAGRGLPMARLLTLLAVVTAAISGCGGAVDYGSPRVCASSSAVVDGRLAREDERFATVKVGGCSGTLIAPSVVITAAHCHNSATLVEAGDRSALVWDRITHPDYVGGWHNDLEILILGQELPGPYATIGSPRVGPAIVSGYGQDSDGNSGALTIGDAYIDTVTQTLALTDGSGSDSCYGDSGGPIYQNGHLVAVTSHARVPGSSCGHGSINVTPDAFADWIDTVTGGAVVFSDTEKCN